MPAMRKLLAPFASGRIGGQTLLAFGVRGFGAAASFALSWLIARQFGPTGTGLFGLAQTTMTITGYAVLLGLDFMLIRSVAGDLREGKVAAARGTVVAIVRVLAVVAPVVVAIFWLAREPFALFVLRQPAAVPVLGVMLLTTVPIVFQRLSSAALRAIGEPLWSQVVDGPIGTTFAMLALAAAIAMGYATSVRVAGSLTFLGTLLCAVTGWAIYRRTSRHWPPPLPQRVAPLIGGGLSASASGLSISFSDWYVAVALGIYWSAAEVGHFRVASQFAALAVLMLVAVDSVLAARVAAAWRVGAKDEIARVTVRMVALSAVVMSPLFLLFAFAPEFLLGLFGPKFLEAKLALQILGIGTFFRLVFAPLGSILIMTGHYRWMLGYAIIGVPLTVVIALLLIPQYGSAGAAMATTLTILVRGLMALAIVHRIVGINFFRRSVLRG